VWAIVYYGSSIGGPHSATVGMRVMDLELRTWYGAPGYFVLGATHAVLFWVSVSFLSPLAVARHRPGNRDHQQLGPDPGGAGARLLSQIMVRPHPSDHDAICFSGH